MAQTTPSPRQTPNRSDKKNPRVVCKELMECMRRKVENDGNRVNAELDPFSGMLFFFVFSRVAICVDHLRTPKLQVFFQSILPATSYAKPGTRWSICGNALIGEIFLDSGDPGTALIHKNLSGHPMPLGAFHAVKRGCQRKSATALG
jgi:hypothetical protein